MDSIRTPRAPSLQEHLLNHLVSLHMASQRIPGVSRRTLHPSEGLVPLGIPHPREEISDQTTRREPLHHGEGFTRMG